LSHYYEFYTPNTRFHEKHAPVSPAPNNTTLQMHLVDTRVRYRWLVVFRKTLPLKVKKHRIRPERGINPQSIHAYAELGTLGDAIQQTTGKTFREIETADTEYSEGGMQ
jgi:hypothetical protein